MLEEPSSNLRINFIDSENCLTDQSFIRRKPGRPPKQHHPGTINGILAKCAVCHDRATGLHYAVMTCEGCKGFFKRSIQAEKTYKCRNKGDCVISKENRNSCQACRMKSCYDMGMKENLVRDDRTPGNRKKKYMDTPYLEPIILSDAVTASSGLVSEIKTIDKEEYNSKEREDSGLDEYPLCKKPYGNYSMYHYDVPTTNFENISLSSSVLKYELLCNNISPLEDFDGWELSPMNSVTIVDDNTSDVLQHIDSVYNSNLINLDILPIVYINCSGDHELSPKKCKQSPKCLMHLLAKLLKARPVEPAWCEYYGRYPSSNQLLDCLADEIHLIIKFSKKTPGFCDLNMNNKLEIIQKRALNILFIRIIYRSLSCPVNHVQFATNLCLNYLDFDKIDILSPGLQQAIFQLISSFQSLNLDIYELCLIQYTIIEDEDWDSDLCFNQIGGKFSECKPNISQIYLKLYTTNKYPDLPHRWIFIMLHLTQVQEVVKLFKTQCLQMVNAQEMTISNEILKEILSI